MPKPNPIPLDANLERNTVHAAWLDLCDVRIEDDRRWPWIVLVPQREGVFEIHDLSAEDQATLASETAWVASALKEITSCLKINTGALGNVTRQMHIHVIARNEGDSGWPGPVWGFGTRERYEAADMERLKIILAEKLQAY
jgi:diadenosine tetraphosphate (Ap4A) HIT family hydrolase